MAVSLSPGTSGGIDKEYKVLEKLGRGAFGTVHKARRLQDGGVYAMKVLDLYVSMGPNNAMEMAVREVRSLVAVSQPGHPNVVLFVEWGKVGNSLWLVMEFCPLGTMNDFLLKNGDSCNSLFMGHIADAVAFLHGKRIVHRDLKPDNVLISGTAQNPIAKVADFGLAKVCGNGFDVYSQYYLQTDMAFVWYGAPEVWDRHYTEKCDVYSMGAMFAAMLDRTTVRGQDGKPLLAVHIQGQPLAAVQRQNPRINLAAYIMRQVQDGNLKQLILRMLAYNYHDRPSASEVNGNMGASGCTLQ
ncbi:hypothetical protein Bbelb_075620 [Branchiostoma belcheri]|nr:hypothetical protein Bbelb_075620 [Branchiostoma belcheri]